IFAGIKQTLEASGNSIVLQVEYMDSKRFRYEETVQPLLNLYRDKFRGKKFDVVIVSDNAAFDFIIQYGEQLFPGVPAVFCGVNDFNPATVASRNITGVVESFDVAANLELALRMHPAMRRMVVIGDQSVTGVAISTQLREALPAFRDRLTIEFWNDY